jgi:hypothetical protein
MEDTPPPSLNHPVHGEQMDIKTIKTIIPSLLPEIAVLMRGPTGVGKSFVAADIAAELGLPFIDVRGSTMQEGDVIGYPDLEAMKTSGVSTMVLPAWFMRACKEPCVLMLDELNRAMPGVMQGFFQVVLDRHLGNDVNGMPVKLHPDTRIIAAVNAGNEYDVNEMDPALLRRFWVCDVEPTISDWIEWADTKGLDKVLVDFVRQNPVHWRVDPSSVEPGTVVPTPASWHRMSDTLVHASMAPKKLAGGDLGGVFYSICTGFIGVEAAIAFQDFVKNYETVVSAEDILDGKVAAADLEDAGASSINTLIDKLAAHCKDNQWNKTQAKRVATFGKSIGGEMMVHLWNKLSGTGNLKNIQEIHKLMGTEVVKVVQASRGLAKS